MKKLKLVSFVQFVVIIDLIQTVYLTGLTQNGNAEFTGGSFKLDCVTDALDAIVQITDPSGVFAANCLIPTGSTYTCIPGPDSNYVASQDVASKTTTVTISTSSRASHEGGWTCTKFGTTPFSKTVTVITVGTLSEPSPPVPNFEVTTSTSKTMTVDVACVYPSAQITWEFVTDTLASTGVNSTGTCTNSGPTGVSCSDASANSSSCTFEVSPTSTDGLSAGTYKLKANLVVVGEVVSTGVSLVLSTVITISGTTTPMPTSMPTPTPRPCQCSWLPCGWKCYYMYIIIIALVLLVCLVVGLCCCYRRGYFGMGSKKENSRENSHVNKAYTSDTENGQPTRSSGRHREQTPL